MRRLRLSAPILAAGAALALVACGENPNPTAPDGGLLASLGQSPQSGEAPSAAQLNAQVPGFGGFFLDSDGTPTIYLTRGAARGNAERALERFLRSYGGASALRVREANYSWSNLERWQAAATDVAFDGSGAVFVDNDETSNVVRVGVEDLSAMGAVRAAVTGAGVPDEAVIVEQADPIVQVATLRDRVRPIQAGLQINFPGFICSIGFNATSEGQASFVTASHCTNTQGGTEGTPYWQPLESVDPVQIATEVNDPVYFRNKNGCPRGRRCRHSDAARAAYVHAGDMDFGAIAKTTALGSITISGSFKITQDDCTTFLGGCLVAGNIANKIGRTTGWSQGSITNTCVNTGVSGSNIVQLCQTFVSATVGGGDSGSDVFVDLGGDNAKLAGTLWGGNSNGTLFVFSPLANVVKDLGPLVTH